MARMGFEDAPLAIALTQQLDLSRDVLDALAEAASPDLALATLARIVGRRPLRLAALREDDAAAPPAVRRARGERRAG